MPLIFWTFFFIIKANAGGNKCAYAVQDLFQQQDGCRHLYVVALSFPHHRPSRLKGFASGRCWWLKGALTVQYVASRAVIREAGLILSRLSWLQVVKEPRSLVCCSCSSFIFSSTLHQPYPPSRLSLFFSKCFFFLLSIVSCRFTRPVSLGRQPLKQMSCWLRH
jgi:hypothetical protein